MDVNLHPAVVALNERISKEEALMLATREDFKEYKAAAKAGKVVFCEGEDAYTDIDDSQNKHAKKYREYEEKITALEEELADAKKAAKNAQEQGESSGGGADPIEGFARLSLAARTHFSDLFNLEKIEREHVSLLIHLSRDTAGRAIFYGTLYSKYAVRKGARDAIANSVELHHPIPEALDAAVKDIAAEEMRYYYDICTPQNVRVPIPFMMHKMLHMPDVTFYFIPADGYVPRRGAYYPGSPHADIGPKSKDASIPARREPHEVYEGEYVSIAFMVRAKGEYRGFGFENGDVIEDVPEWLAQMLMWNLGQYVTGGTLSRLDNISFGSIDPPSTAASTSKRDGNEDGNGNGNERDDEAKDQGNSDNKDPPTTPKGGNGDSYKAADADDSPTTVTTTSSAAATDGYVSLADHDATNRDDGVMWMLHGQGRMLEDKNLHVDKFVAKFDDPNMDITRCDDDVWRSDLELGSEVELK